jgi:hypothetical protein
MTLIASVADLPLMLSDLAASTDMVKEPIDVELPVFADGIQFMHNGRRIAGLLQKSIILAPDFALTWSGPFEQAREIVRRLFEDAPFKDADAIQASIESALAGQAAAVSIFVATTSFCFRFGPHTIYDRYGYKVALAGSGTKHFQKLLNAREDGDDPAIENARALYTKAVSGLAGEDEDVRRFYNKAISAFVSTAANAMVLEALTTGTLEEHYGGGFELIVHDGIVRKTELRKKPMTLVFWRSRLVGSYQELGVSFIIQQFYFGEDLYYLATHLNAGVMLAGSMPRPGGLYIFYDNKPGLIHNLIKVEPIIRIAPAAPKSTFSDISADRIYTHVIFENEDSSSVSPNVRCLTNGPETPNYFEIENMQRGMDLRFSPEFRADIESSLKYDPTPKSAFKRRRGRGERGSSPGKTPGILLRRPLPRW